MSYLWPPDQKQIVVYCVYCQGDCWCKAVGVEEEWRQQIWTSRTRWWMKNDSSKQVSCRMRRQRRMISEGDGLIHWTSRIKCWIRYMGINSRVIQNTLGSQVSITRQTEQSGSGWPEDRWVRRSGVVMNQLCPQSRQTKEAGENGGTTEESKTTKKQNRKSQLEPWHVCL